MISTTLVKAWFNGENNSDNYEYFPFFIRRISYLYEKQLYQRVIEAIKKINSSNITKGERKELFSSAFDARLELLFLSGYFNYWSPNHPDQREVIRFILDYLFSVNVSDPIGMSGSYLPRSKEDLKQFILKESIKGNKDIIGQLVTHLKALAWATTSETIYMAKSIEGPYFIDDLNKFAFIRSYFSLKNPSIWNFSSNYKFDRIDVCTIYEKGKSNFGNIKIDFYGNYSTNFNLNKYSKAIVLVDGNPLKSPNEVSQLTDYLKKLTLEQMDYFRNLPIKEQMKRVMELHCKVYQKVFSFAKMDWTPTQEMYGLVEKGELKPKTEKDEVYKENEEYDEFTTLTLKLIDDANYDNKYSRLCENLSTLSLCSPNGIEFYGGKAINLGILKQKGFSVPEGLIITTEAFKHFMNQNKFYLKIKEKLKGLDIENTKDLNEISSQIREFICIGVFDNSIEKDIMDKYPFKGKVSVRSSATIEDLKEASFAGQFDTFLNVTKENLINSIKKCWASLFSPRAIYYTIKRGFSITDIMMAVLIQEMVEPEVAGVSFSENPLDKKTNTILIEASEGLGEKVVSGLVNPFRVTISKDLKKIEYLGSEKKLLTKEQIIKLTKKTLEIEKFFGLPQDIEWAIADNKIYILQARPISKYLPIKVYKKNKFGKSILNGIPVSGGIATGKACIINNISELEKFNEGEILVTKTTIPEFVIIMSKASGIITQFGGISSHAAIVSRELGIPCIVGCKNLFGKIKDGDKIVMDSDNGEIYYAKE